MPILWASAQSDELPSGKLPQIHLCKQACYLLRTHRMTDACKTCKVLIYASKLRCKSCCITEPQHHHLQLLLCTALPPDTCQHCCKPLLQPARPAGSPAGAQTAAAASHHLWLLAPFPESGMLCQQKLQRISQSVGHQILAFWCMGVSSALALK